MVLNQQFSASVLHSSRTGLWAAADQCKALRCLTLATSLMALSSMRGHSS